MPGLMIWALIAGPLFAKIYTLEPYNSLVVSFVVPKGDGGFVIAGDVKEGSYPPAFLLELDSIGNGVWATCLTGPIIPSWAYTWCLNPTSDGGFVLVCGFGALKWAVGGMVIKISPSGYPQWSWGLITGYPENDYCMIHSAAQITGDDYIVVGYYDDYETGNAGTLAFRMTPSGEVIWCQFFPELSPVEGQTVIQTPDGGGALLARSGSTALVKMSPDGSVEWARAMRGFDYGTTILLAPDNGFIVAGSTAISGAGRSDAFVARLSPSGELLWARTIGSDTNDYASSATITRDGNIAIVGSTYGFGAGASDILVAKLDMDGELIWARTFGGSGRDKGSCVSPTPDSGTIIGARENSFGNGALVMRLGPDGVYPDCVVDCQPLLSVPDINIAPVDTGVDTSITLEFLGPFPRPKSIRVYEVCPTVFVGETLTAPGPQMISYSGPGAVFFLSPEALPIRIYSADGRLVYSGKLRRGKNRIALRPGVYFWMAGPYEGKSAIR